jgi:hypothetical protein
LTVSRGEVHPNWSDGQQGRSQLSTTVPIFNAGDPESCDNYCPISLLSSLSKVLEKIVFIQLCNHLELNNILYEHQYGFQKNKSTEHNLIQLTNYIYSALNEKKFCIGLFLDLEKAFDVCSHEILLLKTYKIWNPWKNT